MPKSAAAETVEQSLPSDAATPFDARSKVRKLSGRGNAEYLDVKWRLVWMKSEHPDASYETTLIERSEKFALFRATVWYWLTRDGDILPHRVEATAHGSETSGDFGDFIEKAETKAIGRALNMLGYGAVWMPEDGEAMAEAPVERQQSSNGRQQPTQPPAKDPPAQLSPEEQEQADLKMARAKVHAEMKRTGASKEIMQHIAKQYGGTDDSMQITFDGFTAILDYMAKITDGMLADERVAAAILPEKDDAALPL